MSRNLKVDGIETWSFVFAVKNMRLSHNSQDESDSFVVNKENYEFYDDHFNIGDEIIGSADSKLANRLIKLGPSHSKFLRFIKCHALVTAPLFWWKHYDTYKYSEKLSSSTMHNLMDRELSAIDFTELTDPRSIDIVNEHIKNKDFNIAIQSLPDGFLQLRAIDTNYECLRNMYFQRRNHKLEEWKDFIQKLIMKLPYNELIIRDYK